VRALTSLALSGPSNEVRIVVGAALPPSAPAYLLGMVNGASLGAIGWVAFRRGRLPMAIAVLVPVGLLVNALGVDTILEGSVRKAGTRVRVTAQLIHASDGHQSWSERYDRELNRHLRHPGRNRSGDLLGTSRPACTPDSGSEP